MIPELIAPTKLTALSNARHLIREQTAAEAGVARVSRGVCHGCHCDICVLGRLLFQHGKTHRRWWQAATTHKVTKQVSRKRIDKHSIHAGEGDNTPDCWPGGRVIVSGSVWARRQGEAAVAVPRSTRPTAGSAPHASGADGAHGEGSPKGPPFTAESDCTNGSPARPCSGVSGSFTDSCPRANHEASRATVLSRCPRKIYGTRAPHPTSRPSV